MVFGQSPVVIATIMAVLLNLILPKARDEEKEEKIHDSQVQEKLEEDHKIIIIGAGNLGQALANYAAFEKRGFILTGIFDVNPRLEGVAIRGVPIRMMDELKSFVQKNDVEIAVLTIPKEKAIEVANMLVENGVRAIWNFAHTDLNLPDNIIVENVHLSESLMQLSYNISRYNEDQRKKGKN